MILSSFFRPEKMSQALRRQLDGQQYVAGFLFDFFLNEVALIRKERPSWQRGFLNGVGGKIEIGESFNAAMEREFQEETGCSITNWHKFCVLKGSDFRVHFFASMGDLSKLQSTTDEIVSVHSTLRLPGDMIPNLKWLLPMAVDSFQSRIMANVQDPSETTA